MHSRSGIKISEKTIQKQLFGWLSLYPKVRAVSFAIPNGGTRNIREAVSLKQQGVLKGVPDLMIAIPNRTCFGLFIELKSENGRVSDHQNTTMLNLLARGYHVAICYSFEDAVNVIEGYLGDLLNA